MKPLLAAEWIKLQKRWMPRILIIILLAILALIFWGFGASKFRTDALFPRGLVLALLLVPTFLSFLAPIMAGSWSGAEHGWGTIRMVLSRKPDRIQFELARLLMVLLAVLLALLLTLLLATLAAVIIALLTGHGFVYTNGLGSGFLPGLVKSFLADWFVVGFYVVLAFAAASIFRSTAAGIGIGIGLIVAQLVGVPILVAIGGIWNEIGERLPLAYTQSLPSIFAQEALGSSPPGSHNVGPGVFESLVGMAIYIAVPLVLMLIVVRNRDVTA